MELLYLCFLLLWVFVVLANWVWNKVSAVTLPVASVVISGTEGEVGADGAHYCNMINHNNFLSNKLALISSQLFFFFYFIITGFTTQLGLFCFVFFLHKIILPVSSFLP